MAQPSEKRPDARTLRSYRALSDAMVDLMRTHEFDAITVQDLLDRAGVGRATFYSHFRNKHDFLLSDLERMLEMLETHFDATAGGSRRIVPLAELLAHLGNVREFAQSLERSGKMEDILDIMTGHFARIIERRLRTLNTEPKELPLAATSRVLAAMATELAKWWLGRERSLSAQDVDDRFHELVWRGIGDKR